MVMIESKRRIDDVLSAWIPRSWQFLFWLGVSYADGAICGSVVSKILFPGLFSVTQSYVLDIVVPRNKFSVVEMRQ